MKRTTQRSTYIVLCLMCFGFLPLSCEADATLNDYYSLRSKDPAAAKSALSSYVSQNPADTKAQLELAYVLMNEKHFDQAITHLKQAQAADPNNDQINLQLAYAYKAQTQGSKARQQFVTLSQSTVAAVATSACQAVIDMAPTRFRVLPRPLFADAYINPLYLTRFNDTIFFSQLRAGAAFGSNGQTEVYGSLRYTDDNQSIGGAVPDIISDNAAVFAGGVRIRPFKRFPISVYGEAGRARDLDDRSRDRWRDDYRAGAVYFDRWAPLANCAPNWRFPFKRSSSLYVDASVYSRYNRDWIGYVQWREGVRVLEKSRLATDAFVYLGGSADSNNVYYNNTAEIGVGGTLTPDQAWPFFFRYTAVKGSYVNIGSPIPTKQDYTDHRWEMVGYLRF